MKKVAILLLVLCPSFLWGQVTEQQKQEALNKAKEFCSLLEQYSNGGTSALSYDQKIFNLCSSRNISTYDDISSNKEIILSSYLSLITKLYKNNLKSADWLMQNGTSSTEAAQFLTLQNISYSDIYIIVKATHRIPHKNITTTRNIIYSTAENKIISFSNNDSPYIMYGKGLQAFAEKKYHEAAIYFENAANAPRFDKKTECLCIAALSYGYAGEKEAILNLIDKFDNPGYKYHYLAAIASEQNDYAKASTYLEEAIKKDYFGKAEAQIFLAHIYAFGYGGVTNKKRALELLKDAWENGKNPKAAYNIFMFGFASINSKEAGWPDVGIDVSDVEMGNCLLQSANAGYVPAYVHVAYFYWANNEFDNALYWARKSAELGNALAMALLGKILIEQKSDNSGIDWLKKAIQGNSLELELADMQRNIFSVYAWPSSKDDVLTYINEHTGIHTTTTTVPVNNAQSTTTTSNPHSQAASSVATQSAVTVTTPHNQQVPYNSNHNYSNSSNRVNRTNNSKKFNSPVDKYIAGVSIGYVQKQWTFREDGIEEKGGFWNDSKQISGVQLGIRVEPLLNYGFGIDTGLYYEYYYSKSSPMDYIDGGGQYTGTLEEHAIYLPIHLEYRLNFSKYFQLFFYGGIGLDYGIANTLKYVDCYDSNYSETLSGIYESDEATNWKRFNYSLEYGAGIRSLRFQLNVSFAKGLYNMSSSNNIKVYQNKNLMATLSIML